MSGLAEIIFHNVIVSYFTMLSLCQRLNTEEAKTRLYIPPKISTFPSNQLYSKTFQLLFFIHSLERSIDNLVFDQCGNRCYYLDVDASEPEILLYTAKSIESPPLGVNTKKILFSWVLRLLVEEQNLKLLSVYWRTKEIVSL